MGGAIAIVAFVSAVMVIGLKLISTIWDDAEVYNDLRRLGMKRKKIKGLITKQMLFVYFIPTVLGCIIGAFTTYRIMLVSGVIYIGETMQLVGCVCGLVLIIQIARGSDKAHAAGGPWQVCRIKHKIPDTCD